MSPAPIVVGAIVAAATSAAERSEVKTTLGSSAQIASLSIGRAARPGVDVRTIS